MLRGAWVCGPYPKRCRATALQSGFGVSERFRSLLRGARRFLNLIFKQYEFFQINQEQHHQLETVFRAFVSIHSIPMCWIDHACGAGVGHRKLAWRASVGT